MKRLVVHVGPRKTGSTSIQRMLVANRDVLRARGVHPALAGAVRGGQPGSNIGLVRAVRAGTGQADRVWARLADEIARSDARRFVVSAEDLASPEVRVAGAARLAELAQRNGVEVEVVGYVRPQWQLLESEYAQRAEGGRVGASFAEFVEAMLAAGGDTILDYGEVFGPYRALFGPRVRVFPLEPSRLPGGLPRHFLALLGVADVPGLADLPVANRRAGAKTVEVTRLVRAGLEAAVARVPNLRRRLPRLPRLLDGDAPFAGFDVPGVRCVQARFESANAVFARDYGIDAGGRLFRDAAAVDGPRPNIGRWDDFGSAERRRVTRYVFARTGLDLDKRRARRLVGLGWGAADRVRRRVRRR